jgi:xylulokinase
VEYLLGIDVGTYESKGTLVDRDGTVTATASIPHELSLPRPGWAEADADAVWWHDLVSLARELPAKAGVAPTSIAAIGCSAIGPCVLPVDRAGKPLRPAIMYGIDTRAALEVRELTDALSEEWILTRTGSALSSQAAGPKILWLRRHEPETWARTARVMTATSYLVSRLTGRVVIDHYTAAAYGPLYDLHARDWSPDAVRHVCDRALLPDLAWSTERAGVVSSRGAAETGLAVGTPVAVGTADAASEAVAAGVLDTGDTMLMYGSTLFFIQITGKLAASRELWPTVYLERGSYALAGGMSTTGALTRWFRDAFAPAEVAVEARGGENAYALLAAEAARVPAGAEGLLLLPYWSGERTPVNDPWARGVIAGLTLRHGRGHVYRAILEGVAYGIRHNLEAMVRAGSPAGRLVAIGGGVRNRLWTQIVSDVTGREQTAQESPGASYGDAALAAVAVGILPSLTASRRWLPRGRPIAPDPEAARFHDARYPLYRELYESTRAVVHRLAGSPTSPRR